jgi:hypothetical protein
MILCSLGAKNTLKQVDLLNPERTCVELLARTLQVTKECRKISLGSQPGQSQVRVEGSSLRFKTQRLHTGFHATLEFH